MTFAADHVPDVSIVIANYNTADYLIECVSSVKESVPPWLEHEVIVIDNGSTDTSVDLLQSSHPDVILITNHQNVGFSVANNQGVLRSRGRTILFLNPDTIVHQETIETILHFIDERPSIGAATCRVEFPDGQLDDGAHRGFPTPWNALCYFSGLHKLFPRRKLFTGYTLGWMNIGSVHEIDALVGAFMLVRREAGEQVGWWDEDYFFYGEDIDFCFKLKQVGWSILFVPDVCVTHYKGASAGIKKRSAEVTTANRDTRVRATRARFDAMRIFYRKHYTGTYPRGVTWLVLRAVDIKEWAAIRSI